MHGILERPSTEGRPQYLTRMECNASFLSRASVSCMHIYCNIEGSPLLSYMGFPFHEQHNLRICVTSHHIVPEVRCAHTRAAGEERKMMKGVMWWLHDHPHVNEKLDGNGPFERPRRKWYEKKGKAITLTGLGDPYKAVRCRGFHIF
jgi:hypothetical protein